MAEYRRPGVYIEEKLATSPFESANATAVACFVGVASKGEPFVATRCESWSDFVQKFGGFDLVPYEVVGPPASSGTVLSYLPYAVYSYFQNGGRGMWVVRTMPADSAKQGDTADIQVTDGAATPAAVMQLVAAGAGKWGNSVQVIIARQAMAGSPARLIFSMAVMVGGVRAESFSNLSMGGIEGTRPVAVAVNDPLAGSRYIKVTSTNPALDPKEQAWTMVGGIDPALPASSDLISSGVINAIRSIEGPLLCTFQPYRDATGTIVMPPAQSVSGLSTDRDDIMVIWDSNPLALVTGTAAADAKSRAGSIGSADSYSAFYTPWVVVPDPARAGGTIAVPPSGAVAGVMARIDVTQGVWRTPAGAPATISNAVAVETKFTDGDQGELNYNNINVIRPLIGAGVCIMGGRTRKLWGTDRYIAPRRTLIYIKETLRRATTFAVFENNDSRLWSALRQTAAQILTPIWEQGGLKGTNASEAFFIRCDSTINTPQVIQSGEVRMEVGVALQYPAEFIVIRISQFDSGASFAVDGIVTAT